MHSNEIMFGDLHYALRSLRHHRMFALVSILSIALGIGANALIFSLADALLLRPLAVERHERVVAVRPCGHGLMLQTLRYAEDLRAADQYFGTLDTTPPDPRMVELTKALIEQKSAPFEPGRFKDDYEAALRALIQSKLEGRKPRRKAPQRPPAEIIDLMQALKRSLDDLQESANANEAAAPKPARGHGRRTA